MLPFPISYYLSNGTEVFVHPVNNGEKYVFTLTTPSGSESSFVWTPLGQEPESNNEKTDAPIEVNPDWKEALDIFVKNDI
jgi:hypothetical protein